MSGIDPTSALTASIYNAAYFVRHYARGGRLADPGAPLAHKRREAIHKLGLVVRQAFCATDDFEPLLTALVDCLAAKDDWPRF